MLRDLSTDPLVELLFELEHERRTAEVALSGCDVPARLIVCQGRLVHAECGDARGVTALERLLGLREGRYELVDAPTPLPRTFDLSVEDAVLPGSRLSSGQKTLTGYSSRPPPGALQSTPPPGPGVRAASRPVGSMVKTLVGTGYSSAPPPALGEERVVLPKKGRPIAQLARAGSAAASTLRGVGSFGSMAAPSEPAEKEPAADPSSGLREGQPLPRVGRYDVLGRLKSGGMGSVYLCRLSGNAGFQRLFAMKVLHDHLASQQEALDLFFGEARILARLHHPNIVGIVDVGGVDQPYLVLDYVEGGSLRDLLRAGGNVLEPRLVLAIVHDALRGLSAAHQLTGEDGSQLGLVHNDISPHNLLVGVDGTCRVTDFGVAKVRGSPAGTLTTRGKPSYVAPERLLEQPFDHRADIFSMGVVLYQALTGVDPFFGETAEETLRNVLERPVLPPSEVGAMPPPGLDWICMKALSRDPYERFQAAEEMAGHLHRAMAREDLLVSPSDVGQRVRSALGSTLEARHAAAQQGVLTAEGRRRASTIPPGALGLPLADVPGDSAPPSSGEFGERTEVLSAPPRAHARRKRNVAIYAALVLAIIALVLVIFFPEQVEEVLQKQPPRAPLTQELLLGEEPRSPPAAALGGEAEDAAEDPEQQPGEVRLPPITPSERPR